LRPTNTGFFYGRGETANDFNDWREVSGAENTKIIRDIVQDKNGEIYCSSDLGVYKLNKSIGENVFYLEQLPIFGPASTEGYALLYDNVLQRLLVSNNFGLFESVDGGKNWFFIDEFTQQKPIYALLQDDNYIFALTDFMVFRKSLTTSFYQRIGVLEDVQVSRLMVIWQNRIYVSTDLGLLVSSSRNNIYTDSDIKFEIAFPNLQIKNQQLPITSLNVIDGKLFIGTENRLYISERTNNLAIHFEQSQGVMPTIYINGEPQK
jgi:ligand-binding sensor domain-containing protein